MFGVRFSQFFWSQFEIVFVFSLMRIFKISEQTILILRSDIYFNVKCVWLFLGSKILNANCKYSKHAYNDHPREPIIMAGLLLTGDCCLEVIYVTICQIGTLK